MQLVQSLFHRLRSPSTLPAPAAVTMSELGATAQQMWEVLFPGEQFSQGRAPQLAARLRRVADELQAAGGGGDSSNAQGAAARSADAEPAPSSSKKRKKGSDGGGGPRELDFGSYHSRYVALELLYLGGRYQGFATQADTEETIEGHLFRAMRKTRLISPDASWQDVRYSRGGRTDRGVSALGQVVALKLRSAGRADGLLPSVEAELDYPTALNRALPEDIRIIGWTDVLEDFSARFSAQYREYKYFFVQQQGGLDLGRMAAAAAHFVGDHDFRNFCKMDVEHVKTFRRTILDFRIERVEGCAWGGRQLFEIYIRGTAFLWHQVRCMAAVLFMVGRGEEEPDVVAALLDVAANPRKPQYNLAAEDPLLLYSCTYPGLDFRRAAGNYDTVQGVLTQMLDRQLIAAGMLSAILGRLGGDALEPGGGPRRKGKGPRHVKLLQRAKEPALEERMAKQLAAGRPVAVALAAGDGAAAGAGAAREEGGIPAVAAVGAAEKCQ